MKGKHEPKIEMETIDKLNSIEGIVLMSCEMQIQDGGLAMKKRTEILPDGSVINALERILIPRYENTIYTWKQIKDALLTQIKTVKE